MLEGQRPHILAAHMHQTRVILLVVWHVVLNISVSVLDHVERGSVDDHRVPVRLSGLALVEVVAGWNWLVAAQGVPKSLPIIAHTLGRLAEATVRRFDVGVSAGAIALVLHWL